MRTTGFGAPGVIGLAIALALAPPPARADGEATPAPPRIYHIPQQLLTDGFRAAHPDMDYRMRGIALDKRKNPASAAKEYRRAAYYGDKPSQARLGEMYWNGQGVGQDPVQGFLWMALAAERGQREFTLLKLYYWQHLDAGQQAHAREQAPGMEEEYGDKAALHRLGVVMRRELRRGTSSLLGYNASAGPLWMSNGLDPELYYSETFWKPEQYVELRDRIFEQHYQGRVDVGDVEQLPDAAKPPPGD
ncbi:MAG: sel1 repeat family protein [Lysobacteraceae bacterium]|nr:MAG: sel1 repeat family protein [Xanthomonadaceae bacterium]